MLVDLEGVCMHMCMCMRVRVRVRGVFSPETSHVSRVTDPATRLHVAIELSKPRGNSMMFPHKAQPEVLLRSRRRKPLTGWVQPGSPPDPQKRPLASVLRAQHPAPGCALGTAGRRAGAGEAVSVVTV